MNLTGKAGNMAGNNPSDFGEDPDKSRLAVVHALASTL